MCEQAALGKTELPEQSSSSSAAENADSKNGVWSFKSPHSDHSRAASYSYSSSSSSWSSSSPHTHPSLASSPLFSFLHHHAAASLAERARTLTLETQLNAAMRRAQQLYNLRIEWPDPLPSSDASDQLQRQLGALQHLLEKHANLLAPLSASYPVILFTHNSPPSPAM
jgi:hypothetical protein